MSGDKYIQELAGIVALPDRMDRTLLDYARAIRVCLETEQRKINPDNALIATLCDAARVGWEYINLAEQPIKIK